MDKKRKCRGGKQRKKEIKREAEKWKEREREREKSACGITEKDRLKSFKLFFPLNNPTLVQIQFEEIVELPVLEISQKVK